MGLLKVLGHGVFVALWVIEFGAWGVGFLDSGGKSLRVCSRGKIEGSADLDPWGVQLWIS